MRVLCMWVHVVPGGVCFVVPPHPHQVPVREDRKTLARQTKCWDGNSEVESVGQQRTPLYSVGTHDGLRVLSLKRNVPMCVTYTRLENIANVRRAMLRTFLS